MSVALSYDGTVVLNYDGVPGSANKKRGQHWTGTRDEKAQWEGIFALLAMKEKLPRRCRFLNIEVELQFTTPNTRRDAENFRQPIVKPLNDALVKGGWIEDDTEDYIHVGRISISDEKLKVTKAQHALGVRARMTITIDYLLGPSHHAPLSAGGTDAGGGAPEGPAR
jgi:hypothetical protein